MRTRTGTSSDLDVEGSVGASQRLLRVIMGASSKLYADRTIELFRAIGIDARTPAEPTEQVSAIRARLGRIRRGLAADAFLHVYGQRDIPRLQAWLARLGIPTVMVWIGSDVLFRAPMASKTVTTRTWHWCVAPWLRDELAQVGITAEVVRLTPPPIPDPPPVLPPDFTVLAYALEDRSDLYGLGSILELAHRRPDISFLLLGAESVGETPENVTRLGWVDDPGAVMARSTVYVRPTSHDGLSNLVLEALAAGRYVLWTYPFPGAEAFDALDEAERRLGELSREHAEGHLPLNREGREAVIEMFDPARIRRDTLRRLTMIKERRWPRPTGRFMAWSSHAALWILRATLRSDRAWTAI